MQVVESCKKMESAISDWERDFFIANDRLPTLMDYPKRIQDLLRKKKITSRVLAHEWSVTTTTGTYGTQYTRLLT